MINIDMNDLPNIRNWTEGKSRLFAVGALLIASFEDDFFELSEMLKKGWRIEEDVPLPRLENWLKMYHSYQKVIIGLFNALSRDDNDAGEIKDFYKDILRGEKELKKMSAEQIKHMIEQTSPDERKEIFKKAHQSLELLEKKVISIYREKKNGRFNEDKKKRITELSNVKEVLFFLRVLFPCFNVYRVYPIDLLRNAESGDNESLKNLLRLDKSAIFHAKIREIVHKAQGEKKQQRMSDIKKAFGSAPNPITNPQKIRSSLAGLIQLISIRMKQKITVSEIYRLFNAIELDMGWGGVDPEDIKMKKTDEKTVKHYRRFWNEIIPQG